jgi:PTS system ascorbate-specific IIB component
MMKKGLVVCRTGMGSSMMLCIKLNSVIEKNHFPLELEHDVLSGVGMHNPDVVIVMNDLVDEFKDKDVYVIGIRDIMDTKYMEEELKKFFKLKGE